MTDRSDRPHVPGYSIVGPAVSGSQGSVYQARQIDSGQDVAIKLMPGYGPQATVIERESTSLGALQNHPNVVTMLQTLTIPGYMCLVMTWCARGSVQPDRSAETVTRYGIALCGALSTANDAGIFHGDIKPANVLVDSLGQARLTDFGVAAVPGRRSSGYTPEFAPPERPASDADSCSDQYSLAKTLQAIASSLDRVSLGQEASMNTR